MRREFKRVNLTFDATAEVLKFLQRISDKYLYSKQEIIWSIIRKEIKNYKRLGEYKHEPEPWE